MADSNETVVILGGVAVILLLACMYCRKNPPAETCLKPFEPIDPPVVKTPVGPNDPPIKTPTRCPDFPTPLTDPFPKCYNFQGPRDFFPAVNSMDYRFYPKLDRVENEKDFFNLAGWFARENGSGCSVTTADPTFGGRFYRGIEGECGGVY
jgi:hypothetical protein